MTKSVEGKDVKRSFEKDGVTYVTISANVDPDGRITGYSYEARIEPPGIISKVLAAVADGVLIGLGIAIIICIWGIIIT